jgi:Ca2+-binding EF-hand superfamily protein
MGRKPFICKVLLSGTIFCLAPAQAQYFPQGRGGRGFDLGGLFPNAGLTTLDTDRDGVLSPEELAAAPASLTKLDRNSDGRITEDELPATGGRGGRGGREGRGGEAGPGDASANDTVQTLMAFDANHDGKISKEELPERMQGMLERGDANHDGVLTEDEIRKLASSQAAPQQQMRRQFSIISVDRILSAIDTDHDGVLSAEEIRNSSASLRNLDQNGDGKITPDETRPTLRRPGGRFE